MINRRNGRDVVLVRGLGIPQRAQRILKKRLAHQRYAGGGNGWIVT